MSEPRQPLPLAVCGLDCNACTIYKMGFDVEEAEVLLPMFLERGWLPAGSSAQTLMEKGPWCLGCRGDRQHHWSDQCALMLCCLDEKGHDSCAACAEFACHKLQSWGEGNARYSAALEHLRKLNQS